MKNTSSETTAVAASLLPTDLTLKSCRELETLWAGYGHICAITASTPKGSDRQLILKLIAPPPPTRDKATNESHQRKMLSYEVEQYFYNHVAPKLPSDVAVAECIASSSGEGKTALVLADLRTAFPVAGGKREALSSKQAGAALDWLARFHAASWAWLPDSLGDYVLPPLEEVKLQRKGERKLWLNGGYTYLATRRDELASLKRGRGEWSRHFCQPTPTGDSIAELVAIALTPRGRAVESYIHGDVKSENLFTTEDGSRVAFFDFQYVGLGLGVCDLAKLFTCSVPLDMLTSIAEDEILDTLDMGDGEKALLERYRAELLARAPKGRGPGTYEWDEFVRHWETALVDWCRFQASWGFWGNTTWLEARVRHILGDRQWRAWLDKDVEAAKAV